MEIQTMEHRRTAAERSQLRCNWFAVYFRFCTATNILFTIFGIFLIVFGSIRVPKYLDGVDDQYLHEDIYYLYAFNGTQFLILGVHMLWMASLWYFVLISGDSACAGFFLKAYVAFPVVALVVVACFAPSAALDISQKRKTLAESLEEKLGYSSVSYLGDSLGKIQETFHCCGVHNYTDWSKSIYFACYTGQPTSCSVHITCCKQQNLTGCNVMVLRYDATDVEERIYTNGCVGVVISKYKLHAVQVLVCTVVYLLILALNCYCSVRIWKHLQGPSAGRGNSCCYLTAEVKRVCERRKNLRSTDLNDSML